MNILLPDYDCVLEDGVAEIKNKKLYLYKNGVFKDMMYKLTYMIFGSDECYYCHRKLYTNQTEHYENKLYFQRISMDHLIPKDFGGPTITNNLRPACTECNTKKGNMFEDEYYEYLKVLQRTANRGKKGRMEKRLFRENIQLTQRLRRYGDIPCLPEEWISKEEVKCILVNYWIGQKKGGSYGQMVEAVKKYNHLVNPITITANSVLVDGFNANLVAIDYEIVPYILKLDNVIYSGFPIVE